MSLPDWTPLADAKAWLRARLREGERCPLCTQRAQVYRRTITGEMAAVLVRAHTTHGADWFHMPTLTAKGGDAAKLRYWGLIEEEPIVRPDGGRAGWWRVTPGGAQFARDELAVPRHALVYDGRSLGLEGELVTVRACLGAKFDLEALLAGAA